MEMVMPVVLQLVKLCIVGLATSLHGSAGFDIVPSPAIFPPKGAEGTPGPAQHRSQFGSAAASPPVNAIAASPSNSLERNGMAVAGSPSETFEPMPPVNSPIKDHEVSPTSAPPRIVTGSGYGIPSAATPDNTPGPVPLAPANHSKSEEQSIPPSLAPYPGIVWKRDGIPVAAPPSEKPELVPPVNRSQLTDHNISPAPSTVRQGGELPLLSPPSRIPEPPTGSHSPPREPDDSPASISFPSTPPRRDGMPFATPPTKASEPIGPVIQTPSKEPGIISPASSPPPSITWKRNEIPVAAPPKESPKPKPPVQRSPIKEPDKSPPISSNPPPSVVQGRGRTPASAPSDKNPKPVHVNPYPRKGSSPAIAPHMHKDWRQPNVTPAPSLSSPQVPSNDEYLSPASSPSISSNKHNHTRNKIISPVPVASIPASPPSSRHKGTVTPPVPLPGHSWKHNAHPHHQPGPSAAPSKFPIPLPINHISPAPSPRPEATSGQSKKPFLPPKTNPSGSLSRTPKTPPLTPMHVFPPPPPNEDCSSTMCSEPFTNSPPGSPCGCVWPMQVGLRLGVDLYTFFPLVSELAAEVAAGVFMKQSQVRIMGANAASQQLEKTVVLIDLVPLGKNFDKTTAFLTFERFWHKQVVIKASNFGHYEVLYVRYPGLPPSPPMASSDINMIDGGPYSGNGDDGRTIKPLGVDVPKRQHKNNISGGMIAIIVLSGIVAVMLCSAAAWVFLYKHKERSSQPELPLQALPSSITKSSAAGVSRIGSGPSSASLSFGSSIATYTGSAKTFSTDDIEKATDNFNPSRILGEGGFGRVYSGILEDGTAVAVKVLKRDDQQGSREFLAEIEMLSRLHHRNLVKLIGMCIEERNRCLVYELIPNGSVESHLHGVDKETSPLDWAARIKIALGAARGLAYLHEDSSPRVIHRDFKSSNILLEDDFTPKVSDFGLARTALDEENRHISTRVMGTFGYVAPEYAMTGHLLVKSDVYSYGVVLLELLTGRKPVDMSQPPGEENLVAWARPLLTSGEGLEAIVDPSLGPEVPFDSVAKVAAIASMCVQPEVSHRPFMGEVVQALKLVCTECDEAKEMGSSQDDISIDTEARMSGSSEPLPNHLQSEYGLSHLESGYDPERGISMPTLLSTSARLEGRDSESFRRHSSSGPLRTGRGKQFWKRVRRLSGGSLSEHGAILKFWPSSH